MPERRRIHAHPAHRLDHHDHPAHAGHGRRRRLDIVGPMPPGGAISRRHRRTQNAGQHLPANKEPEREVHVSRRHAAKRPQHQHPRRTKQGVVLPGVRGGQPAPARGGEEGGHGRLGWMTEHSGEIGETGQSVPVSARLFPPPGAAPAGKAYPFLRAPTLAGSSIDPVSGIEWRVGSPASSFHFPSP
ncbi:hypothetical protein D3C85_1364030 [compost metagenome]